MLPKIYEHFPDFNPNILKLLENENTVFIPDGKSLPLKPGQYNFQAPEYKDYDKKISAISIPAGYYVEIPKSDETIERVFFTTSIPDLGQWNDKINELIVNGPYVVLTNAEGRQLFLKEGNFKIDSLLAGLFKKAIKIEGDQSTFIWRTEYNANKELKYISIILKTKNLPRSGNEISFKETIQPKPKTPINKKKIIDSSVKSKTLSNLIMDKSFQTILDDRIKNSYVGDIIRIMADSIQMENNIYIRDREIEIICNYFTSRNYILSQTSDNDYNKNIKIISKEINHAIISTNGNDAGFKILVDQNEPMPMNSINEHLNSVNEINNRTKYSGQDAGNIELFYTKKNDTDFYANGGSRCKPLPMYLFAWAKRQAIVLPSKLYARQQLSEIRKPSMEKISIGWDKPISFFVQEPTPWQDTFRNGNDGVIIDKKLDEVELDEMMLGHSDGISFSDLKSMSYEIQNVSNKARLKYPTFFTENYYIGNDTMFVKRNDKYTFDPMKEYKSLKVPKGYHVVISGRDFSDEAGYKEFYYTEDVSSLPFRVIKSIEIKHEGKPGAQRDGYIWQGGRFFLQNDKYIWRGGSWEKK